MVGAADGSPAPREVVVDTDTGIDDALALLVLAAAPGVRVAAVGAVYGNTTVAQAADNAAHVLALAGLDGVPVALGAAGPLEGEAHIADYVHGRDGLGDALPPRPSARLAAATAAEQLVALGREHPGRYDLLALGPLTNLALALREDPLLLTRYRSVVVMGGSGPFQAPGRMLMVDANTQNDALAAAVVHAAPRRRLVMVGVDTTGGVVLDEEHLASLDAAGRAGSARAAFATAVLGCYARFYAREWGRLVLPVHDGTAAAVLVQPELVTASVTGPVAVVDTGYQRRARVLLTADGRDPVGVPAAAPGAPEATAVTAVDADALLGRFTAALVADLPQ